MTSGTKDNPIILESLTVVWDGQLKDVELVPDHWYHYKGVTFRVVADGMKWEDENGHEVEPNGWGGWL